MAEWAFKTGSPRSKPTHHRESNDQTVQWIESSDRVSGESPPLCETLHNSGGALVGHYAGSLWSTRHWVTTSDKTLEWESIGFDLCWYGLCVTLALRNQFFIFQEDSRWQGGSILWRIEQNAWNHSSRFRFNNCKRRIIILFSLSMKHNEWFRSLFRFFGWNELNRKRCSQNISFGRQLLSQRLIRLSEWRFPYLGLTPCVIQNRVIPW